MNFEEILTRILDICDFPKEKKSKFFETFYEYYLGCLIEEIGGIDTPIAQKLLFTSAQSKENPQAMKKLWAEMNGDQTLKETIDKVTDRVLGRLVDDIAKFASEKEKQQILAILPAA